MFESVLQAVFAFSWHLVLAASRTQSASFIWGVISTWARCKTQFYTINSSDSCKDYSLEIFSQACQLMFTVCAAAQINAPAPNGEARARKTEWSFFNFLTGTIQKALRGLPFFARSNYEPLIIISGVLWIGAFTHYNAGLLFCFRWLPLAAQKRWNRFDLGRFSLTPSLCLIDLRRFFKAWT